MDSFVLDSFPEGWRPKPGDQLIGTVISIDLRTTEYGSYPILTIRTDDRNEFAFHAFHTVAQGEIKKLEPRVGDRIGVGYHGPHPQRGYERYRIQIARGTSVPASDDSATENQVNEDANPPEDIKPSDDADGIPY